VSRAPTTSPDLNAGAVFSRRDVLAPSLLFEPPMDGLLSLTQTDGLVSRFRRLRNADPFMSLAEAAARLDVVEAELVSGLCGEGALRLDPPFGDLVRALPQLGRVRAVTRNALASIETHGVYPPPELGCAGVAGEVGVRFGLEQWRYGYVLDESTGFDETPVLAFYDARGNAIHEVHAGPETAHGPLAKLIDVFACFDQSPGDEIVVASPHLLVPRRDLAAWLRSAEDARPVGTGAVSRVLESARQESIPISIAVRSAGSVQRFSGLLHAVVASGGVLELEAPWVRVRASIPRAADAWVVRAPSLDGPFTSLEVLDHEASVVLSLSAARWPGKPEPPSWRELIERLPTTL
jgi:putative hemin transport protein